MAGVGSDCSAQFPGNTSCLASGGRVDVVCCSDYLTGTACQYKPGLTVLSQALQAA